MRGPGWQGLGTVGTGRCAHGGSRLHSIYVSAGPKSSITKSGTEINACIITPAIISGLTFNIDLALLFF